MVAAGLLGGAVVTGGGTAGATEGSAATAAAGSVDDGCSVVEVEAGAGAGGAGVDATGGGAADAVRTSGGNNEKGSDKSTSAALTALGRRALGTVFVVDMASE
ncbi:MAG TPA: hypothetical protein VER11_17970 [Polyangiaceae bacterium]|nr:hypothetical protein [Polyangiaceae bacterium]